MNINKKNWDVHRNDTTVVLSIRSSEDSHLRKNKPAIMSPCSNESRINPR